MARPIPGARLYPGEWRAVPSEKNSGSRGLPASISALSRKRLARDEFGLRTAIEPISVRPRESDAKAGTQGPSCQALPSLGARLRGDERNKRRFKLISSRSRVLRCREQRDGPRAEVAVHDAGATRRRHARCYPILAYKRQQTDLVREYTIEQTIKPFGPTTASRVDLLLYWCILRLLRPLHHRSYGHLLR